MARVEDDDSIRIVTVSRREALNLISLLASQLADEPLPGNFHAHGEVPELNIEDRGHIMYRMVFVLDREAKSVR